MVEHNRDITQRLNYFDRQFLRAQDFVDEQNWILDRTRRHNRLLHTAGIGEGLVVSALSEVGQEKVVLVNPGTAYDNLGRELIVTTPREVNLKDLKDTAEQFISPVFLTIVYGEDFSEPSTDPGTLNQPTRVLIKPDLITNANVPTEPEPLLLAVISRDPATGNITAIDTNPPGRKRANTLPSNSISSETLADQSVQNRHVAVGAVTSDKIAVETIQTTNLAPDIQNLFRQIPRMSTGLSIVEPNLPVDVPHNLGNVVVAIIIGITDLAVPNNTQENYGNSNQTVFATVDNTVPNGTFQLTSLLPASANIRWWALALPQ